MSMLRASSLLMAALVAVVPASASLTTSPREPAKDYDAHVAALKKRLPSAAFEIVVQPPFVVIGDGGRASVERWASGTVKWAVDHLKKLYFADDPKEILDVWLFKDGESYRKHAKELFGELPDTPFGYFSPRHRALVMNIATGGGTLVHEIVHPFVAANFPGCPAWFNEGLGSLYEQCGERGGRIVGFTNWRLDGLQKAIHAHDLPSFETLCGTSSDEFYGEERGVHYAQARYLLYWLQEKGQLVSFWTKFRKAAADGSDRTGYATLKGVLAVEDMEAFQKTWETWVLGLKHE